jgi:spore maturation protein CgeB
MFLKPDAEVLVARDGQEVAEHVRALTPGRAREIGEAGRARILSEHTYERRGAQLDAILREEIGRKRGAARTLGGSSGGSGATSGAPITEGRFA